MSCRKHFVLAVFCLIFPLALQAQIAPDTGASRPPDPYVTTDKADYDPGETVAISGLGFQPGETIKIVLDEKPQTHPSITLWAVANSNGEFANTDYALEQHDLGVTFKITATGQTSGLMAVNYFTDHSIAECPLTVDPSAIPSGSTFNTIQDAITHLPNPGPCEILIKAGTYLEFLVVDAKNSLATLETQRIVIRRHSSAAPGSVIVTAPGLASNGTTSHAFTLTSSKIITIMDLVLAGSARTAIRLRGDVSPRNNDITIAGNDIVNNGTGGSFEGVSIGNLNARTWIFNNLIRQGGRGGVATENGSGPTYTVNNTIFGNKCFGVQRAAGEEVHLINNLIVNNGPFCGTGGTAGLTQPTSGSPLTITLKNNIFYKNIRVSDGVVVDIANPSNTLDATDSDNLTTCTVSGVVNSGGCTPTGLGGIAGCTFGDCLSTHSFNEIFVNATADFHLKSTAPISPAIDKGTDSYTHGTKLVPPGWVPTTDFEGTVRPQDGDGDLVPKNDPGYDEVSVACVPANCDDGNPCTDDACVSGACVHTPNTASCSDACHSGGTCSGGACTGGTLTNCNDGNACTTDTCDPTVAGGCVHTNNSAPCSDACHSGGTCSGGACTGGTLTNCNDGNACTTDTCDPTVAGGCVHTNNSAPCSDACHSGGTCSGGACTGGTLTNCNDGNACTTDTCDPTVAGGCVHTNNSAPCSDACHSGGTCSGGACTGGTLTNCNDGNACTTDTCDPTVAGGCVHTNNSAPCSDACHSGGTCSGGACTGGTLTNCNDGNACTTDTCDPTVAGGCVHTNNSAPCSDACHSGGTCSGGACTGGTLTNCNDGNACTTDTCDPTVAGGCVHTNNSAPCSDACHSGGTCSGGACTGGTLTNCNDGNACTTDTCDPTVAGGCVHTNNSAPCSDACHSGGTCSGGACTGGTLTNCNDGNACTTDTCDPTVAGGCVHTNNSAPCSDACHSGGTCSGGACTGGTLTNCNDGNACTTDTCDPTVAGGCVHTNNSAPCSDACHSGGTCSGGACTGGTLTNCNDGNACTTDTCDPTVAGGCVHTNNSAPCSDACHSGGTCSGGACTGGTLTNCNDGNACTTDTCDPTVTGGCVHTPNTAACDDGNACTTNDTCRDGLCVGGSPLNCDDNDACTVDTCNPTSGCTHPSICGKMTGGGQIFTGKDKRSFGFNAKGIAGLASGHFNYVIHPTKQKINGRVALIVYASGTMNGGEMKFEVDMIIGTATCQYFITATDNGEGKPPNGDRLRVDSFVTNNSICPVENMDQPLTAGNIQWHNQ